MSNEKKKKGKYAKRSRRHIPIVLLVLVDALLVGVILLTFAFFHHAMPAMVSEYERLQALENPTEPPVEPSTVPEATEESATEMPSGTEAPTEPDDRTPWQIKFQDKFTGDVVLTDHSYSSPEVSITIDTVSVGEGNKKITYHVADIYVASLENFATYTAYGKTIYFGAQEPLAISKEANAILAINGDYLTAQKTGFLMRNGEIYTATTNMVSICVLFEDGTMETFDPKTYEVEEILERGAVQIWSFGPVLLDENGKVRESYDVPTAIGYNNPRSAVGYYEPGHYCFVMVDGRQNGYSKGMSIPELAQLFEDLGCTAAYNLDGGASAVMVFDQQRYSRPSNGGRDLGDILLIRDSYYGAVKEEGAAE